MHSDSQKSHESDCNYFQKAFAIFVLNLCQMVIEQSMFVDVQSEAENNLNWYRNTVVGVFIYLCVFLYPGVYWYDFCFWKLLNPSSCLNFPLPPKPHRSEPGLHMIPNRSISVWFMHRWQMKLSYLFKAFSIYLSSLKSSFFKSFFFFFKPLPVLTPYFLSLSLHLFWCKDAEWEKRKWRKPEGWISGGSWFYFSMFESCADVCMKQGLQCDWQFSLVWPMSRVPWAC